MTGNPDVPIGQRLQRERERVLRLRIALDEIASMEAPTYDLRDAVERARTARLDDDA